MYSLVVQAAQSLWSMCARSQMVPVLAETVRGGLGTTPDQGAARPTSLASGAGPLHTAGQPLLLSFPRQNQQRLLSCSR